MNAALQYGPWIAVAVLAALVGVLWTKRPRHHSRGARNDGGSTWREAGSSADYRTLTQAVSEMRRANDDHAAQLTELRTHWSVALKRLEDKIDRLGRGDAFTPAASVPPAPSPARSAAPLAESPAPRSYGSPEYGATTVSLDDSGRYGAESLFPSFPSAEPAWAAGPSDRPVEIRDGLLVLSNSLPPAAFASMDGGGRARVYLNPDVQISEFALPKWQAFFEMTGAQPYATYRTRRPAEVRWDDVAARGELISKGLAEAA
jgi:hypothetical protein